MANLSRDISASESSFSSAAGSLSHVTSAISTPHTSVEDIIDPDDDDDAASKVSNANSVTYTMNTTRILLDATPAHPTLDAGAGRHSTSNLSVANLVTTAAAAHETTAQPIQTTSPAVSCAPMAASESAPDNMSPTTKMGRAGLRQRAAKLPGQYNLSRLAGTDIHGMRAAKGDAVSEKRRLQRRNRRQFLAARAAGRATKPDATASHDAHEILEPAPSPAVKPAMEGRAGTARRAHTPHDATESQDSVWSVPDLDTVHTAEPAAKSHKRRASEPVRAAAEPVPQLETCSARRVTRSSNVAVEDFSRKLLSTLHQADPTASAVPASKLPRELRIMLDTPEYAKYDLVPTVSTPYSVYGNRKASQPLASASASRTAEPSRAGERVVTGGAEAAVAVRHDDADKSDEVDSAVEQRVVRREARFVKKYLDQGLYANQNVPQDISLTLTASERRLLINQADLDFSGKPNKALPLPLGAGLGLIVRGRDFKLPFDICNPLPPGQPRPAHFKTMDRNRWTGEAAALWKKQKFSQDYQSKCVCTPERGCREDCQNKSMLYECTDNNCNAGGATCRNRAFATLQERTEKGGPYRIGAEVFKTADRGFGIRSNRQFEPGQIIMEYIGEIITYGECQRRMTEKYHNDECWYVMSWDGKLAIDATNGSIARFVNHSCAPNCRMVKWHVDGHPRMGLFAGDSPIMTGEELTYDYNFDNFSAKNVQKCLCGSDNCRGTLSSKSQEVRQPKPAIDCIKKTAAYADKRKLGELLAGAPVEMEGGGSGGSARKRRVLAALSGAAQPAPPLAPAAAVKVADVTLPGVAQQRIVTIKHKPLTTTDSLPAPAAARTRPTPAVARPRPAPAATQPCPAKESGSSKTISPKKVVTPREYVPRSSKSRSTKMPSSFFADMETEQLAAPSPSPSSHSLAALNEIGSVPTPPDSAAAAVAAPVAAPVPASVSL